MSSYTADIKEYIYNIYSCEVCGCIPSKIQAEQTEAKTWQSPQSAHYHWTKTWRSIQYTHLHDEFSWFTFKRTDTFHTGMITTTFVCRCASLLPWTYLACVRRKYIICYSYGTQHTTQALLIGCENNEAQHLGISVRAQQCRTTITPSKLAFVKFNWNSILLRMCI